MLYFADLKNDKLYILRTLNATSNLHNLRFFKPLEAQSK